MFNSIEVLVIEKEKKSYCRNNRTSYWNRTNLYTGFYRLTSRPVHAQFSLFILSDYSYRGNLYSKTSDSDLRIFNFSKITHVSLDFFKIYETNSGVMFLSLMNSKSNFQVFNIFRILSSNRIASFSSSVLPLELYLANEARFNTKLIFSYDANKSIQKFWKEI